MSSLEGIENEINRIKQRNRKVEADKAWETSWLRKLTILVLTYLVIVVFFYAANLPKPFLNAIVPAVGFILSTLTLGIFKKYWLKRYNWRYANRK